MLGTSPANRISMNPVIFNPLIDIVAVIGKAEIGN